MNITLLGNYPHDGHESMTRYAEMLKGLLATGGHKVEIIRPEPFFGRLKPSAQGVGKWLGYLDKYIVFPLALRRYVCRHKKEGAFLVHICDQSNAIYTRWLEDTPHVVTCHDVMAILSARGLIPGIKTSWTGQLLQNWILSGLSHAANVVCDTEETRHDLLVLAPELEPRSCTIEIPLNYPYAPMPRPQAIALLSTLEPDVAFDPARDQFLFHVGGNQWYKNREGVLRIYAELCSAHPGVIESHSLKLVMAGKPPTESMRQLVADKKLTDRIAFVTAVSDQQLCAFYSLAEALVYPSLKEGFGWPVVEAQACACPVVTSNRPPMNRLAGPAGLLADPESPADLSSKLAQILLEEANLRRIRKDNALLHSASFDPQVFLKNMCNVYASALSQK